MLKRNFASNLILFLFFILVASASLFSDMFQNPIKTGKQMIEQSKLFTSSDLLNIQKISLKNKSGEFQFERNDNNQTTPWHMIAPRDISANSVFIEKLFNSLAVIKVKKLFPDEKINSSNFSLDKPMSTLSLLDQNGKSTIINFGLMNSIDNSTYLKILGKPGIYHVEAPNVSLENATLLDLIESQIIAINLNSIESFKIYKGNKKASPPTIELIKKDKGWFDSNNNLLASDKIDEYFQDILSLKSSFLLENQTELQKKSVSIFTRNSEYIITINDNKGKTVDYFISTLFHSFSDLDLKNEDHFLMTVSNSSSGYIVKKEFYELFSKKIEYFRAIVPQPKELKKSL